MALVNASPFAARRRAVRSSRAFRLVLASCLLFCLLLSWASSLFYLGEEESLIIHPIFDASRRAPADGAMVVNAGGDKNDDRSGHDEAMASRPALLGGLMPLRVISFNIRYATANPVTGEQPWKVRGPRLGNQLSFITAGHENAFICLQESLFSQINDIQSQLGDSWSYVGKGRDDGHTKGEFSPIFYRSDVWKVRRTETRWLSETPERPSRGWDAVLERIVTMGEFSHRVTGTRVVVMSTHFDHVGVEARRNSAKLLIRFAKEWSRGDDDDDDDDDDDAPAPASAVLIGGDLNSTPDDGAYRLMTAPGSGMSDVSDLVPGSRHYGNHLTYTSFGEPNEWPKRIDFLFIQEPRTALVRTFGVLANSFDDQIRVSDHRPVVADMEIAV